jgi:3-hydroxy-9,10-secoandrosta-1,3,5(10)-triene-9,17-dione monooxygenase
MTTDVRAASNAQTSAVLTSSADALERVAGLLPGFAARAAETDGNRRVPDQSIDELKQSGLFGIIKPKSMGGSELGFADLVRVTAEISAVCGSTGWVYGVLAGHSWLLNLFPEQAQREIFADEHVLIGTVFRLGGEIVEEGDGFRLTGGNGRFCSGIDYADWVIIGNAVKKADGTEEPRFFVLPKSEVEVIDDWFTVGMRGTGSRSIKIDNAFIPAHRSCRLSDMLAGTSPGAQVHSAPVYRMPFSDLAPFSIIGAPIGMARGAISSFAEHLGGRLRDAEELQVAEQSATFARIGEASATVDAALALVVSDAARLDSVKNPSDVTPAQRAQIPRDWAYAAQQARYAATRIFEVAGGSAIYDGSAMQRVWRDVNSAAQHFAFTWDSAMTTYSRAILGLKPGSFTLRKRG